MVNVHSAGAFYLELRGPFPPFKQADLLGSVKNGTVLYTTTVHTRGASSMARNRTDVSDHAAHPKGALCHLLCAEDKPHEMPDASSPVAAAASGTRPSARLAAFDSM
jgi:hypothetical protein